MGAPHSPSAASVIERALALGATLDVIDRGLADIAFVAEGERKISANLRRIRAGERIEPDEARRLRDETADFVTRRQAIRDHWSRRGEPCSAP